MSHQFVRHIVGQLDEGVQRCVICGEIISDYRNTMMPAGTPPPKGFGAGEVFVKGGNPIETTIAIRPGTPFKNCNQTPQI
jgi:hypothetical protein